MPGKTEIPAPPIRGRLARAGAGDHRRRGLAKQARHAAATVALARPRPVTGCAPRARTPENHWPSTWNLVASSPEITGRPTGVPDGRNTMIHPSLAPPPQIHKMRDRTVSRRPVTAAPRKAATREAASAGRDIFTSDQAPDPGPYTGMGPADCPDLRATIGRAEPQEPAPDRRLCARLSARGQSRTFNSLII